jgi:nucleoside-diphosphate-sugar epimerase
MNILIVGGTSSVAQSLIPELSKNCHVITAGRKDCDIDLDLKDTFSFPSNIDTVIHTAAYFKSNNDAEIYDSEYINVLGTLKVCQAAHSSGVKHLILISTMYSIVSENSPQYNMYSISKKHAEELASYYCSKNSIKLTILRPSQLYGIGSNFNQHQPFFYNIIDKVKNNEDVYFYGTKDPLRNYLYVDDLSKIISEVVNQKIEGTFSCCYPNDVTYSQIAKAAIKVYNSKSSIYFLKDKPDIADNIFIKDESLYRIINLFPSTDIENGISKIMNSKFKNHD